MAKKKTYFDLVISFSYTNKHRIINTLKIQIIFKWELIFIFQINKFCCK